MLGFFRRHRVAIASTTVLSIGAAVLVVFAVNEDGYQVSQTELHDGGVWVTSDQDGLFGRLNKPAGSLDAALNPPGGVQQSWQLDVSQDSAAVLARDLAAGKAFPVDVVNGKVLADQGVPLAADAQVELSGGTLAVLDPASGKVWAKRVDTTHGIGTLAELESASPPVATLEDPGNAAALAVGTDGIVHALSAAGQTATVEPRGTEFAAARYGQLGHRLQAVRATAVGPNLVVLDPKAGTVILPGGTAQLPVRGDGGDALTLQQPGPDAADVLIASATNLISVPLAGGATRSLDEHGTGKPAAPVRLDGCGYAAWAGAGALVRVCGDDARQLNLKDLKALVQPVFRVNRDQIVLNDLATGAVWDLSDQRKVDDWSAVRPPPVRKPSDKTKDDNTTTVAQDKPPKAVDDTLGARPGRTTVLHVLDNDSDPAGNILAVTAVTAADGGAAVTIAPDAQTVEITLPDQGSGDVRFKYTVDDGKGLNAQASVTVQRRADGENKPPAPRLGYQPRQWTVAAGERLSVPVLADWRDFDGDPVVLVSANAKEGSANTTPAGFVEYAAPVKAGQVDVDYQVSDGVGEPVPGSVAVTVLPRDATTAVAATAEPDVARGQVGQPITVRPLDNDLPGSDPTNPTAKLALAGDVASPAGATVVTDARTGVLTVTATRPGPFLLGYRAAFGNAPFAQGAIRVDVLAAPQAPLPPVAMPDVAVLRGQQPSTVDVLANDFDPAGLLLSVQHAAPASASDQVQVAIIRGRWLRINALTPSITPNPLRLRYTVTNGVASPVTGEVVVTQLAPPASDTPVPKDDYATVRAGDVVTIPVLDNDTTPGGSPITLQANVSGAPAPGQLAITTATGGKLDQAGAYVTGNVVRFVAPPSVNTPQTVTVDYVAQDPVGDAAVGHAHVTVVPAPTPTTPDQPPAPQAVEARAVAGDSVVLTVLTTGVDPDGDSVTVTGISAAPMLGRITGIGANSLTYQAYPTSSGTDSFRYQVIDRYGKTGEASVRVAVSPPGDPQPPVAVDDVITAAPGAHLAVDVLANDLTAPDDAVTVEPLAARNPGLDQSVKLSADRGPVELTSPGATGKPLVVVYGITDGIGDPSVGTLTVRGQPGYDIPPVAGDVFAKPQAGAKTVEVNVLDRSGDLDGAAGELKVSRVFDSSSTVDGERVTLPVLDYPRAVGYELRDAGGATAVGYIYVPAPGSGAPYAKPDQTIKVDRNGSTTVNVADYVIDPAGKQVKLTLQDRIWASPDTGAAGLKAASAGDTKLTLTGFGDYTGPAAVIFEVTDGNSLTDKDGHLAVITVPVQVGPPTPVLRCPDQPLTVIEGGATVRIDVTSVCHVWVADPATLADLRYNASWQGPASGVTLDDSGTHTLSVTAGSTAAPGATATMTIGVDGANAVAARLSVRVVPAPPPSVAPVTVDGVKAGETATVNLVSYVRSQLREPAISVRGVTQTSGMPASASQDGATVRITPGADAHGTMTFTVVVADVTDAGRTDRQARGQITLHVLGVPDAPGVPEPGRTVLSQSIALSWSAPANNGAPIDYYEVDYGGQQRCPASPCTITGLTNGQKYTFTVKAHNLVGWGKPSGPVSPPPPDEIPTAVTGLSVSDPQDGTLKLAWTAPAFKGTPVKTYEVTWGGGGHTTVTGTNAVATGLDNDTKYTFSVVAVNALGPGPAASVPGQSSGAPDAPAAVRFSSVNAANADTRAVRVSWDPVDPNGIAPTTYTLTRTGGGSKTVCSNVTATNCPDDGLANDGTVYTYTLTAANGAATADPARHTSPPSPGTRMEATATPDPVTGLSVTPTGANGQATVRFNAPASHGGKSEVSCTWNGNSCGTWTYPTGGQSGATQTISGLPNGQTVTVSLKDCNGGTGSDQYAGTPCDDPVSQQVTTYGPIGACSVSASGSGPNVNFSVSVNPNGKPAQVHVQTSRQSQNFTTGVGAWGWSGSDNVGYSNRDDISVTVTDAGRATVTCGAGANADPAPPPPASITAWQGAAGWSSIGTCPTQASGCNWLYYQVHNFPLGSYTWRCVSNGSVSYSSTATVRITDPNQTFATASGSTPGYCVFGRGITEQIEINGVTSNGVRHNP